MDTFEVTSFLDFYVNFKF